MPSKRFQYPGDFNRGVSRWAAALLLCLSFCVVRVGGASLEEVYFSGDVQVRGYHTQGRILSRPTSAPASSREDEDTWGSARLQWGAEAFAWDHVHAKIQIRAEGYWGRDGSDDRYSEDLSSAYLHLQNVAFTPLSLKIGRQTASFGQGLILGDDQETWFFDAARATYEALPMTFDLMVASVAHLSPDTVMDRFGWVQGHGEYARSLFREMDLYLGVFSMQEEGQPLLVGTRSVVMARPDWQVDAEAAYQFGENEVGADLSAAILDLQGTWHPTDARGKPEARLRWTFASGDDEDDQKYAFQELFHVEDWGQVFSPRLSNIHILSGAYSMAPLGSWRLGVETFVYVQADRTEEPASSGMLNNGGLLAPANGENSRLGWEVDVTLTYQMAESTQWELMAGHFEAGDAYDGVADAEDIHEIRLQIKSAF